MPIDRILSLAQQLIRYPSVSGHEAEVMGFMHTALEEMGWSVEQLPVHDGRSFNVLATHGKPAVIFTTHLDVVPAPEALFAPKVADGKLFGRGACDAKGIAAVMVEAANSLRANGASDLGLLFVVEEELSSAGAKAAAPILKERGTKFIIDGEPTDCCLVTGHKGILSVELSFEGRAAHSGYPELGEDANAKMIRTGHRLLEVQNWGESEKFGKAHINLGICRGGTAMNVISPSAMMNVSVRTVAQNSEALAMIREISSEASGVIVRASTERVEMFVVDGFETKAVAYGTDVPHLKLSGAECLLYGPGSIGCAHTDGESLALADIERAFDGYRRLYQQIRTRL